MIQLSQEQCQELTAAEPVAIDPETKQTYVLVRAEVYAKLRPLLEEARIAVFLLLARLVDFPGVRRTFDFFPERLEAGRLFPELRRVLLPLRRLLLLPPYP